MKFQVTKDGRIIKNIVQIKCPDNLYGRYEIALAQAMYEIYRLDSNKCWESFGKENGILKQGTINFTANTIQVEQTTHIFVPKPDKNSADAPDNFPRIRREKKQDEPFYCIGIKGNTAILAGTNHRQIPEELMNNGQIEFKFSDNISTGVTIVLVNDDDKKAEKKGSTKKAAAPKQSKKKQEAQTDKEAWTPSEKATAYNDENNRIYRINENRRYHLDDTLGDIIDDSYLKCEKLVIDCYNTKVKNDANRIYFCAFFELGLQGSIENALVLICNQNCGFTDENAVKFQGAPNDIDAFEDEEIRRIILKIREAKKKDKTPEPHIALLKEVRELEKGAQYPFVKWFRRICKGKVNQWLIDVVREMLGKDKTDDEIYDWLAYHFASRELVFYHTHEAGNIIAGWKRACKEILGDDLSPHQKVVINDLKEAIKLRIPIFMSRSQEIWMDYVKELKGYDLLFSGASSGGVYLSSNNLLLYQDKKNGKTSDEAKKKAWRKFTEALKKRYRELSSK